MDSRIWGPSFWMVLHTIAINYPESPPTEVRQQHAVFFRSLVHILPCNLCRVNYKNHLDQHGGLEKALESKTKLFSWLVAIHNDVNRGNGKKEFTDKNAVALYYRIYDGMLGNFSYSLYFARKWILGLSLVVVLLLIFSGWLVLGRKKTSLKR